MYSLIRIVLFLVTFLLACYLSSKMGYRNRRKFRILSAGICFVLCSVSHYFPIENTILTFRSPEEVFGYTNFEEIQNVVDGNDSCLIVYPTDKSTYSFEFVGKHNENYIILPQFSSKMISRKNDPDGIINVYHVENTNDFYIIAALWEDADVGLYNDSGKIDNDILNIENSGLFYIYVHNFDETYYLLVDEKTINICN